MIATGEMMSPDVIPCARCVQQGIRRPMVAQGDFGVCLAHEQIGLLDLRAALATVPRQDRAA